MSVRLLRGDFFSVDGFAINDFESIADGAVTDITQGLTTNGECDWGTTTFFQR